jgi:hypothetical protein
VVNPAPRVHNQAAVEAAIADGGLRDTAQHLSIYVRNQNPRLSTLPLARDLRLTCSGCEEPVSHQLAKLAATARLTDGALHTHYLTYLTLTVASAPSHRVQEFLAINGPLSSRGRSLPRSSGAGPGIAWHQLLVAGPGGIRRRWLRVNDRLSPTGGSNRHLPNKPSEPIRTEDTLPATLRRMA